MRHSYWIFVPLSFVLSGCGGCDLPPWPSSRVEFSQIEATYRIVKKEGLPATADAVVRLQVRDDNGLDDVFFDQGETLALNGVALEFEGGVTPQLEKGLLGPPLTGAYFGSVNLSGNESQVDIVFTDKGGQPHSQSVDLLNPVSVTSPVAASVVNATTGFDVTYDPPLEGKCAFCPAFPCFEGTEETFTANPPGQCSVRSSSTKISNQVWVYAQVKTVTETPPSGFQKGEIISEDRSPIVHLRHEE